MALTDNIVAYYKFDESSGNASDSVGSNTLTNVNSTAYGTGKINNGADFEASSSNYFTGSVAASLTTNFTVAFWLKLETNTSNRIYQSGTGAGHWDVSTDASGFLRFTEDSIADYTSSTSMSTGTWYHCAIVKSTDSGTNVTFYINGVAAGTASVGSVTTPSGTAYFGGYNGASNFLDGVLDEFGLWSRALTADDISKLYNAGRGNQYPFTDNLTTSINAYWKLDESSGNASDSVGSITLTNNGTTPFATGKINNGADFGNPNTTKYFTTSNTLGIDGGAISYAFWMKPAALSPIGDDYRLFEQINTASSKTAYRFICKDTSGTRKIVFNRLAMNVANVDIDYNITMTTGTWYHIAYTYDGSTMRGYVNGSEVGNNTGSGNGNLATGYNPGVHIGADNGGSGQAFDGMMDEIGVWSRALTAGEVSQLYNSGSGLQYPFVTSAIKTVDGLAIASVKTVDGLAIASVKTINGLA